MQVVKVTNALWVANIAPLVQKFVEKMARPNLNYHTVVGLFQTTAQFGAKFSELWVCMEEDTPVGFARWHLSDLPLIGTVYWDCVYSQRKGSMPLFLDKFLEFAQESNAPYIMFDAVNEKMANHFIEVGKTRQLTGDKTEQVRVLLRRP